MYTIREKFDAEFELKIVNVALESTNWNAAAVLASTKSNQRVNACAEDFRPQWPWLITVLHLYNYRTFPSFLFVKNLFYVFEHFKTDLYQKNSNKFKDIIPSLRL